jgi:predicted transcriptional regulator of viral defense system
MIYDKPQNARQFTTHLATKGRYHFTSCDVQSALAISADAAKLALHRLRKQGEIASPARGFYVIVPPEYRSVGCLPAEQFIPALMALEGRSYYAGLLTAAQFHGAAHQRPQSFQVMVDKARRAIHCGSVDVVFYTRKGTAQVPKTDINTPRGALAISSPEATAIDLVGYHARAGGLSNVATVLSELAESIQPEWLVDAATAAPTAWLQRLGYLLECVDAHDKADPLKTFVQSQSPQITRLTPGANTKEGAYNADWKLLINDELELDI